MRKAFSVTMLALLLASMLTLAFNTQQVNAGPETLIIIGTTDSVESCLDPARAYDYFGWEIIQSLGCGLLEYKPGATGSIDDIVPSLATSWSVSDDGLVWTFNLREDVHYHDGTEFNATHVKYSFDRAISIADSDGAFVGIGYDNIIGSVEVTGEYQVRFHLKIQFSPFLSLLALPPSFIVNPTYAPIDGIVSYVEGDARASYPTDLGPYILTEWVRSDWKDIEMKLGANPAYWNASGGYPKTKNITIKFYADSTGLALAIQNQEVDIAFRQLAATDINNMKTNTNLKVWEGTGAFIQYLVLQEKYAPFNNTKIRQAVGAAINRTTIVQTVFLGQAQNLYSMIPIGMFGHTDAFLTLGDPNYTRTRELLGELGYNETDKLSFKLWYETSGHYPQSPQQAQVLKSSLEASGVIAVTLDSADWPSYRTHRQNEDMEAYILGWNPDYIDPDDYVQPFLDSSGGSWLHHNYNSSQMDKLIAWARGNTTAAARSSLYSQIQNLMVEDCPIIPTYQGKTYAVTNPSVEGICLDISQHLRYWLLLMTKIEPTTWIVDDDGPADFSKIQDAINAANPGDTIHVKTGVYYENILLTKTLSLIGEDREDTIIDAEHIGTVVLISGADYVTISGFTIRNSGVEYYAGIYLSQLNYCSIIRNDITDNLVGVLLYGSSNNKIAENNLRANSGNGISLTSSSNNTIIHNNIINNTNQVYIYQSIDNKWDDSYPSGGNYWSNYSGTDLCSGPHQDETGSDGIGDTPYVIDVDNQDRYPLMHPWSSLPIHNMNTGLGYETIQEAINADETLDKHTIFVEAGAYYENVVVNKAVSLFGEDRDTTIIDARGVGTAVLISANNVSVTQFTIKSSGNTARDSGIFLDRYKRGAILRKNRITENPGGIVFDSYSGDNIIDDNIITENGLGLLLKYSANNIVTRNMIEENGWGIGSYISWNNLISDNVIRRNNETGIHVSYYPGTTDANWTITNNTIASNKRFGVNLEYAGGNLLRNNAILNNGFNLNIRGQPFEDYIQDIDESNKINGKPIYYWINQHGKSVPADAGYVAALNSTEITVKNLTLAGSGPGLLFVNVINSTIENLDIANCDFNGIYLWNCSSIIIRDSAIVNCTYGILLDGSSDNIIDVNLLASNYEGILVERALDYPYLYPADRNIITRNTIINNDRGISLYEGRDNNIYRNNFVNNTVQVNIEDSIDVWDNGYVSGGNFWSDYTGVDVKSGSGQDLLGSDGIGDTPYIIDANNIDRYPLMSPYGSSLAIAATVDIDPGILNLKGKLKWVNAYIELPEGYNISDVDVSTLRLNMTIPAELEPTAIGDYDSDTIPDLMVEFNRTAVSELALSEGIMYGNATLTVTGKLYDGALFEGSGVIKVRMPGDINCDGKVDVKDIALVSLAFGSYPGHPRWNPLADENEDGKIDVRDVSLIAKNFGKTYP
ncbi:ABC transporter substrate-binding protein [Candidatus Bathyarchaeota archaeon]|nr:ABC transporter substrate-binding protein [Candidatus Bathyarchaeota archaeon]